VFVINKEGEVLVAESGSPTTTVEVVKKLVGGSEVNGVPTDAEDKETEEKKEDAEKAQVADEVADTAAKLDGDAEGNGEAAKA
jgi:hypothetical protein